MRNLLPRRNTLYRSDRVGIILVITIVCLVLIAGVTANILKNVILQQRQIVQWQERGQLELLINSLVQTAILNPELQQPGTVQEGTLAPFADNNSRRLTYRLETIELINNQRQIRISAELLQDQLLSQKMTRQVVIPTLTGE